MNYKVLELEYNRLKNNNHNSHPNFELINLYTFLLLILIFNLITWKKITFLILIIKHLGIIETHFLSHHEKYLTCIIDRWMILSQ